MSVRRVGLAIIAGVAMAFPAAAQPAGKAGNEKPGAKSGTKERPKIPDLPDVDGVKLLNWEARIPKDRMYIAVFPGTSHDYYGKTPSAASPNAQEWVTAAVVKTADRTPAGELAFQVLAQEFERNPTLADFKADHDLGLARWAGKHNYKVEDIKTRSFQFHGHPAYRSIAEACEVGTFELLDVLVLAPNKNRFYRLTVGGRTTPAVRNAFFDQFQIPPPGKRAFGPDEVPLEGPINPAKLVPSLMRIKAPAGVSPETNKRITELVAAINRRDGKKRNLLVAEMREKNEGPAAMPPLALRLTTGKIEADRSAVAAVIGEFGPQAVAAIPALLALLDDESEAVQTGAIRALGHICTKARKPQPAEAARVAAYIATTLGTSMKASDRSHLSRRGTFLALAEIGPAAGPTAAAIVPFLKHEEERVQGAAAEALGAIGGKAALDALPTIRKLAAEGETSIARQQAQGAVEMLGKQKP